MVPYVTNNCLNLWVFNNVIWFIKYCQTNRAVVTHPLCLVSAHYLCWVHFSNSCKSLPSFFNEQVAPLPHSDSHPHCFLSLPIDKSKWANTESMHLYFRPSITATFHNSLNSNTASYCRVNKCTERKGVNWELLPITLGAWFIMKRSACPVKNSHMGLTQVVNQDDTGFTLYFGF